MRLYGLYRGRPHGYFAFGQVKTAVQLFTVIFILFVIGLEEAMGRFAAGHLFFLDDQLIQLLANALLAGVLLLTLLSGFHYLFRASSSLQGILSAA